MAETSTNWLWLEIVTILVIVTGILSNGIVLVVFFAKSSHKLRQKWRNLYILQQSIIDGSSLIGMTLLRSIYIDEETYRRDTTGVLLLCKLWVSEYLLWAMYTCSTYNLVLLSIERYLAVVHPIYHRTRLSRRKVFISMGIPWIIGFAFQSYWPPMYRLNTVNGTCLPAYSCVDGVPSTLQTFLTVYSFVGEYGIALAIMSFAYVQIVIKLGLIVKRAKQNKTNLTPNGRRTSIARPNSEELNSVDTKEDTAVFTVAVNSHQSRDNLFAETHKETTKSSAKKCDAFSKAKRSTVRTFVVIFVLFVVCWTPTEVVYLRHNLCIKELDFEGTLYDWMSLLVVLNAVLNPFIYTGLYSEFQRQLRRVLCNWKNGSDDGSWNSHGGVTSCEEGNSFRKRSRKSFEMENKNENTNTYNSNVCNNNI